MCAWRWTARSSTAAGCAAPRRQPQCVAAALEARPSTVTSAVVVGALCGSRRVEAATLAPVTVTRFSYQLPEGQQFQNTGRQAVAISPDGTQILYVAAQRLQLGRCRNLRRDLSRESRSRRPKGTNPVFSPDGRSIAFRSGVDGTLKRIAVRGGAAVTICPVGPLYGMSWGADGILFGEGGKGIMRVSPNGGQPELLVSVKDGELAHGPQMLPGGQAVLFTLATAPAPTAGTKRRSSCRR